jgi:hypothetical protein
VRRLVGDALMLSWELRRRAVNVSVSKGRIAGQDHLDCLPGVAGRTAFSKRRRRVEIGFVFLLLVSAAMTR